MGFFNPGLGFSSTIGAFIGGAARQANQNMENAQAAAAQEEKLWIAKFAQGQQEYEKEEKQRQAEAGIYQTALNSLGGNARAADDVVRLWRANPKIDITEIIRATKASNPNLTEEPGYTSQTQGQLQDSLQRRYDMLNRIRQGMRPQMQRLFPMPNPPTDYSSQVQNANTTIPNTPTNMPGMDKPDSTPHFNQFALGGEVNNPIDDSGQNPYNPVASPLQPQDTPQMPSLTGTAEPASGDEYQVAADNTHGGYGGIGMGPPKGSLNREMLKPEQFNTPDGYRQYIKTWNESGGATPDLSDLRVNKDKLPPEINTQVIEAQKHSSYMSAEDRKAFAASVAKARQSGNTDDVRWDLVPSQEEIARQDAIKKAGSDAAIKYDTDLQKRGATMTADHGILVQANRMLDMLTNPAGQLQASQLQPLMDGVNRFFNAAGIDLRQLGLPANKIEDVNGLKKILGDMTFQQISQYHLGRWTNYEVGILKDKLPSIDTDPNSMVKVALLFKNAAQREINTYQKENEIAYGPNGENLFYPKDLGKAKLFGINAVNNDEGKAPWLQISNNHATKEQTEAYNALPQGAWFEDTDTGAMGRKGMFVLPSSATTGKQ